MRAKLPVPEAAMASKMASIPQLCHIRKGVNRAYGFALEERVNTGVPWKEGGKWVCHGRKGENRAQQSIHSQSCK